MLPNIWPNALFRFRHLPFLRFATATTTTTTTTTTASTSGIGIWCVSRDSLEGCKAFFRLPPVFSMFLTYANHIAKSKCEWNTMNSIDNKTIHSFVFVESSCCLPVCLAHVDGCLPWTAMFSVNCRGAKEKHWDDGLAAHQLHEVSPSWQVLPQSTK